MTEKEIIAVVQAFENGKRIQCKFHNDKKWEDAINPIWDFAMKDYRIKPESKLRPYANTEEFRRAQRTHSLYIRFKADTSNILHTPLAISNSSIFLLDADSKPIKYSFSYIMDNCEFEDGAPCGIVDSDNL